MATANEPRVTRVVLPGPRVTPPSRVVALALLSISTRDMPRRKCRNSSRRRHGVTRGASVKAVFCLDVALPQTCREEMRV